MYKKIADLLIEKVYARDFEQCRRKIKILKGEYKKFKDSLRSSGAKRGKKTMFFFLSWMSFSAIKSRP